MNKHEWAEVTAKEMAPKVFDTIGLEEWLFQGDVAGMSVEDLIKDWRKVIEIRYLEKEIETAMENDNLQGFEDADFRLSELR